MDLFHLPVKKSRVIIDVFDVFQLIKLYILQSCLLSSRHYLTINFPLRYLPWPQQQQGPSVTQRQVTYQTGEIYIGQWLQVSPTLGYPHGWGRKYGNNEFYEGQWFEGLKHGFGNT